MVCLVSSSPPPSRGDDDIDADGDPLPRKLESMLDGRLSSKSRGRRLDENAGFKKGKVVNEVLDRQTVMTLHKMISGGVVASVNGPVSAGKESVVFWAVDGEGTDVALKIYLVSTSNFKRREPYILGDPRFARVRRGTRNMVHLWARKEFRNLSQCAAAGIPVPRPVHVANNVLAMDFVGGGGGGAPCRSLQESRDGVDGEDYRQAVAMLGDLYSKAGLVHGDYSEFNMFKTDGGLVLFDLGSAVDVRHPNSGGLLRRDIANISRFFAKRGIRVRDPGEVFEEVTAR